MCIVQNMGSVLFNSECISKDFFWDVKSYCFRVFLKQFMDKRCASLGKKHKLQFKLLGFMYDNDRRQV